MLTRTMNYTLNFKRMSENFDDLDESYGVRANKFATNGHFEAFKSA